MDNRAEIREFLATRRAKLTPKRPAWWLAADSGACRAFDAKRSPCSLE